jgi:hypothetical protein
MNLLCLYHFSFLKNETRITECLHIISILDTGGLVFDVVQRLPSGVIRPQTGTHSEGVGLSIVLNAKNR